MELLVVGWSDIVRRRVLPAATALAEITRVHVASTSSEIDLREATSKAGSVFSGPDATTAALDALPDSLVYVSGVNNEHAIRVLAALERGNNVIVDKPAFLSAAESGAAFELAEENQCLLAQASVWSFHSQVSELKARLADLQLKPRTLRATFSIPALPESNFRTQMEHGGGVVADMGTYAMSVPRVFGTGDPVKLRGTVTSRRVSGIDESFIMNASYSDGLLMSGVFSMNAPYKNRLELEGEGWHAALQPVFSSRPDEFLTVALRIGSRDEGFTVRPTDTFAIFLLEVLRAIEADERHLCTQEAAISSRDLLALASVLDVGWQAAPPAK